MFCGFSELFADKAFCRFRVLGPVASEEEHEGLGFVLDVGRNGNVTVAQENIQSGVYHSRRGVFQLLFKGGVKVAVDKVSLFYLGVF